MAKPRRKAIRSWYLSLTSAQREALFEWMRRTADRALKDAEHARSLEAPLGEIAVGAGAFDPFLRAEGAQEYLSALRRGRDPDEALEEAKQWGSSAVAVHNAKRPKDATWQRWEGSGSDALEGLRRSLLRAIEESP